MKKQTRTAPPVAILINIPTIFLDEQYEGGEAMYRRVMERPLADDGVLWHNFISNIPVYEVLWCYIAFKGFVHYRCNIVCYEKNVSHSFTTPSGEVVTTRPRNWVILGGPLVKAPRQIPQKGFRFGFRYIEEELF